MYKFVQIIAASGLLVTVFMLGACNRTGVRSVLTSLKTIPAKSIHNTTKHKKTTRRKVARRSRVSPRKSASKTTTAKIALTNAVDRNDFARQDGSDKLNGLAGLSLAAMLGPGSPLTSKCIEDDCAERNRARLKQMVEDKENRWVYHFGQETKLSSGVRLVAYSATVEQLDCAQLAFGKTESAAAISFLDQTPAKGSEKARFDLLQQVTGTIQQRLAHEYERVCLSATTPKAGFESRSPGALKPATSG